ncbi:LPS export ABC transporter permease LptF [Aliikangiella marina]|uniref:Lipopolysaccharide export system permease protein LptF n=1 Tax=Aliikangiella marina TaxID=1712262 RepID=A0A545THR2_9GAMM|nr:LPS export ABC transporter permease LptF [Aliikangiella marina]TQV76770.1 LPS export ABC transporter permease LptF [Aliikangiella marina]
MILKRYINSEILRTCGAILVVLILIFISTRFIKYIQLAVEGTISSASVFSLLGLQLPAMAGFLLPLSFFIAILLTFGRLYSDNEMAVISSVGVGELQLAKNILPVAVILAILSAALSFYVNPWSSYQTKTLLAKEKAEAKFGAFSPGRFQENLSRTGVVFVESKDNAGEIQGVFAVTGLGESNENIQVQTANKGRFWNESGQDKRGEASSQDYLVLEDGVTYSFDKATSQWSITEYGAYFMRVEPPEAESLSLKNKSLSTAQLLDSPSAAEWAELHWRLAAPLSIIVLCFMAVPLARTQPRKGKFSRLFPAIMIYLAYALLMMNGRRFIESEKLPEFVGLWWTHLIAIGFCFWLFRPTKRKPKKQSQSHQKAVNV